MFSPKNQPFLEVVRELDSHSDLLYADFAKQNKCLELFTHLGTKVDFFVFCLNEKLYHISLLQIHHGCLLLRERLCGGEGEAGASGRQVQA